MPASSVTENLGVLASVKSISPVKVGLAKVLFVKVCVPVRVTSPDALKSMFPLVSS